MLHMLSQAAELEKVQGFPTEEEVGLSSEDEFNVMITEKRSAELLGIASNFAVSNFQSCTA